MKTILFFSSQLATLAFALAPTQILFQGFYQKDGSPVQGVHTLNVQLCPEAAVTNFTGCLSVFESNEVTIRDGYYSVFLGSAENPLPSFDQQWYVHSIIDSYNPSTRIQITSAPSALFANQAGSSLYADSSKHAIVADSAFASQRAEQAMTAQIAQGVESNVAVTSVNGLQNAVQILAGGSNTLTTNGNSITITGPDVSTLPTLNASQDLILKDGAGVEQLAVSASRGIQFLTTAFEYMSSDLGPCNAEQFGRLLLVTHGPATPTFKFCSYDYDAPNDVLVYKWKTLQIWDLDASYRLVGATNFRVYTSSSSATCSATTKGTIQYFNDRFMGCTYNGTSYLWKYLDN